jgi:hypothetical protein
VKSEPKAFASLSSGLLARKGAARPAMRPQGFAQTSGNLDDLGWNDMGFEPPKPSSTPLRDVHAAEDAAEAARAPFAGLTPLESPVHSQQAQIVDRLSAPDDAPEEFEEAMEIEAPVQSVLEPDTEEEPEPYVPPLSEQGIASFAPPQEAAPQPEVAPEPAATPVAVVKPVSRRAPKARSAPGGKGKAAFTLRLDSDRHLKLRLACAIGARSAQQLVTDALDTFLAAMPELDAMAEKAKRKGS